MTATAANFATRANRDAMLHGIQKAAFQHEQAIALLRRNALNAEAAYDRAARRISANEEECSRLYWAAQNAQDAYQAADVRKTCSELLAMYPQ